MRKILHSLKIEMMLLFRNIFFWLLILLSVPTLFILYSRILPFDLMDPFIASTAFVQAGIFAFMILGYYLIKTENDNSSSEVFQSIPNGYLIKATSKVLSMLITSMIIYILSLSVLYIVYSSYSVPLSIYIGAISFLFLYIAIPFFLSSLIGMIVGTYIQSRIAYVLFVIFWFLIGPLNMSIADPLMAIVGKDFSPILHFLNLGQIEPNIPYDPVYGLPLETNHWYKRGIFLAILSCLFLLQVIKINERTLPKWSLSIPLTVLVAVVPLIYAYSQPSQVVQTFEGENAKFRYDSRYYQENKSVYFSKPVDVKIHSYEVEIYPSRILSARANIVLSPKENTHSLVFTLYHRLKVKQIQVNHEEIEFHQQGDQLQLLLPETTHKDQSISVAITYEGISSPLFFANELALMLPNYFAWYPMPGSFSVMNYDSVNSELTQYPFTLNQPIPFTLKYTGSQQLYTNLPQKEPGKWSGVTKDGLTVASGMIKSKRINQMDIYYPEPMTTMEKDIPSFLDKLKKVSQVVNSDLKSDINVNVSKVFFLTVPSRAGYVTANLSFSPNQLIVSTDPGFNGPNMINNENMLVPSLVSSTLLTEGGFQQKSEIKNLFVKSYLYWYNDRFHIVDGEVIPLKYDLEFYERPGEDGQQISEKDQQMIRIMKHLIQFIDKNEQNPETLRLFFQGWLERLGQKSSMTLEEIEQLIQKAEQRS